MTIKVGYWNLRGLMSPIQYLLQISGLPHEVKRYDFDGDLSNPNVIESWLAEKNDLGLDLPNLPYLLDGDVKLTQSLAIMKYIARKSGLLGIEDNAEPHLVAKREMIEQQLNDLRYDYIYYGIGNPLNRFFFPEGLPAATVRKLGLMSKFIGTQKFLFGDSVSYLDMIFFEVIDIFKMLNKDCCETHPNIEAYYSRIRNLPRLKEFLASDKFIEWPVLGPVATNWGWTKE